MFEKLWDIIKAPFKRKRGRTVRIAFPFVFIAALFAGATAILTEGESYIDIISSPSTVTEGEVLFIDVVATTHVPVNAVDIVLEYSEFQMEVIGIDTGESVITLWTEDPYAENGKVYIRGGTFGRGFVGEHKIARVRAKATESGTAYVTANAVRFVAGDGEGSDVNVSDAGTSESRIYIANEDGSLVGTASLNIVTDLDGDGDVDLSDVSSFMAAWLSKTSIFDFNGDGKMTFKDFSILLADAFFN